MKNALELGLVRLRVRVGEHWAGEGIACHCHFASGQLERRPTILGMAAHTNNISLTDGGENPPSVWFGDDWHDTGGEVGPYIEPNYLLVIMRLGEADVSFDAHRCVISPGSVALVLPGRREHYRFSRLQRSHHTWCSVSSDALPASLRKRLARLPPVQTLSPILEMLMKTALNLRPWH